MIYTLIIEVHVYSTVSSIRFISSVCMESRNDYFKKCDVNVICTNVNSIFSVLINFMYMYMYICMHVYLCIPFTITCLYSYYYQRYSVYIQDMMHVVYCINLAHTCMLHVHVYIYMHCLILYIGYYYQR